MSHHDRHGMWSWFVQVKPASAEELDAKTWAENAACSGFLWQWQWLNCKAFLGQNRRWIPDDAEKAYVWWTFDKVWWTCNIMSESCHILQPAPSLQIDTDHCRFFVVWAALISDARRSWRIFDLGSMAASRLPAIAWGHQRGYHVQRAESGCSHPGGTESLRFFPDVTPGFMPRCSALWQCKWLRWSLTQDINIIERCWMTDCRFWMCSTLCFSWQGGWPQWIVNCDSHNQFIFLRFLRGLNFNPSSCMTWDSWQARVRKAKELEAPFGFGMALFRISHMERIWTHTHAYLYIYIYTVVHLYIHLYTQNIRENQIDRFKNLLHVLTGNLDQIKKRIDQRGKEKHGKATTTKDIRGSFEFCLFPAFFACFSLLFPILHCFIFIFCF